MSGEAKNEFIRPGACLRGKPKESVPPFTVHRISYFFFFLIIESIDLFRFSYFPRTDPDHTIDIWFHWFIISLIRPPPPNWPINPLLCVFGTVPTMNLNKLLLKTSFPLKFHWHTTVLTLVFKDFCTITYLVNFWVTLYLFSNTPLHTSDVNRSAATDQNENTLNSIHLRWKSVPKSSITAIVVCFGGCVYKPLALKWSTVVNVLLQCASVVALRVVVLNRTYF